MQEVLNELQKVLGRAVGKCNSRYLSLSGGLDSSILACYFKDDKINPITIIVKDFIAKDLTYSQLIAKELGFKLEVKTVSAEELLTALEETIRILGNFNAIEIRNSVVSYLAIEAVKQKKGYGIITGDGADELFAGYNFFLNTNDLQKELERIWSIMHFPSKKIGEALGVIVETPFLDEEVIEFAKKVSPQLKVKNENRKKYGKWLLRKAFEKKLPKAITWRQKVPLQNGAGTTGLIEFFDTVITDDVYKRKAEKILNSDKVNIQTKESLFYYETYRKFYEPPIKLHSSANKCSNCSYELKINTKFCRMCGSFFS